MSGEMVRVFSMLARTPLTKQCEVGKQIVIDQSNSFVQALHGLMVMDFLLEKGLTQTLHHCTVQIHLGMKSGLPCVVEKQQSECGYHTSRQSLHSSFYSKATREMWVWMIVALHVASHLGIYPPCGAGILSGRSPNEMSSVGLASLGLG